MNVKKTLAAAAVLLASACGGDAPTDAPPPPAGMAGAAGPTGAAGPSSAPAAQNPDDVVVEVGPTKLTRKHLDQAMFRDAVMAGLPPPAKEPRVKELLEAPSLEKMIDRELLRQEAERRGLLPTPDAVEQQRQLMISSLPQGKTFEGVLQQMGVDEATFLADLRVDMGIEKLLGALAAETPPPDDAALKKIYDENPELYAVKETASASHILVKVAPNAPADQVAAAEKKAKQIRDEVAGKGKDVFQRVAVEKSEDPSAKINKGDLGSFERKQMLPEIGDAAFSLKEGEVSPVVRSDKGFHVLFGQGVTKGKKRAFDEVKAEILEKHVAEGNLKIVETTLAKLRESTKIARHYTPKASPMQGPGGPGGRGPAPHPPMTTTSPTPGLAPSSQPAGPGAAGGGAHPAMPLPSKDNVLPGAPNPHGGGASTGQGGGDLKLKVDAPPKQ